MAVPLKKYNYQEVLEKLYKYCSYQERCLYDIQKKIYPLELSLVDKKKIAADLIKAGFVDEKRYANAYVSGKFRNNKWGKIKIKMGLKQKRISEPIIQKALLEINEDEYRKVLKKIIAAKFKEIKNKDTGIRNNKIAWYTITKGFESTLVWEVINDL